MPVCCKAQLEMESEDEIHLAGFPNCSRMMEQMTGLPPVSSALGRGHVSFKPSSPSSVTPVSVQFDGSVQVGLFFCVLVQLLAGFQKIGGKPALSLNLHVL